MSHKLADSATVFGISSKGWPMSFTINYEEGVDMTQRLGELVSDLEKIKIVPGVMLRNPAPTEPVEQKAPEPQKAPADRPATDKPTEGVFDATEILYVNSGDKEGYKIKGGLFHKYGITAYPEMLEGKVNLEELKNKKIMPFKAKVEWYTVYKDNNTFSRIRSITVADDSIPW